MRAELEDLYTDPEATDARKRDLDFLSTYLVSAEGIDEEGNRPPVERWIERTTERGTEP